MGEAEQRAARWTSDREWRRERVGGGRRDMRRGRVRRSWVRLPPGIGGGQEEESCS
jgi:hypothetical protein